MKNLKKNVKRSRRMGLLWTPILIAALVLLPGCRAHDPYNLPMEDGTTLRERESIIQVAVDNQTENMEAALQEESVWGYNILAKEYLTSDAPDAEGGKYNVKLILEIAIGPTPLGDMGAVLRRSKVELNRDTGAYTEDPDSILYSWGYNPTGYSSTLGNLNYNPSHQDYQAKVYKWDVVGKGIEDIALLLCEDWVESFNGWGWGENSFSLAEYRLKGVEFKSGRLVAGSERYVYPDSVHTWFVVPDCRMKMIGVSSRTDDFGGTAFGNDGVWVDMREFMVLTEWSDCYTLATDDYCLKKQGYDAY